MTSILKKFLFDLPVHQRKKLESAVNALVEEQTKRSLPIIPIADNWVWQFPCRVLSNFDGDVIKVEIDAGFGGRWKKTVRLFGIDTPDIYYGSEATKKLARYTRDHVAAFVASGTNVVFVSHDWVDNHGPPLGDIVVDGKSLVEELLDKRLAVQYESGNRERMQKLHEVNAACLEEQLARVE